jgi:hypothetical protein
MSLKYRRNSSTFWLQVPAAGLASYLVRSVPASSPTIKNGNVLICAFDEYGSDNLTISSTNVTLQGNNATVNGQGSVVFSPALFLPLPSFALELPLVGNSLSVKLYTFLETLELTFQSGTVTVNTGNVTKTSNFSAATVELVFANQSVRLNGQVVATLRGKLITNFQVTYNLSANTQLSLYAYEPYGKYKAVRRLTTSQLNIPQEWLNAGLDFAATYQPYESGQAGDRLLVSPAFVGARAIATDTQNPQAKNLHLVNVSYEIDSYRLSLPKLWPLRVEMAFSEPVQCSILGTSVAQLEIWRNRENSTICADGVCQSFDYPVDGFELRSSKAWNEFVQAFSLDIGTVYISDGYVVEWTAQQPFVLAVWLEPELEQVEISGSVSVKCTYASDGWKVELNGASISTGQSYGELRLQIVSDIATVVFNERILGPVVVDDIFSFTYSLKASVQPKYALFSSLQSASSASIASTTGTFSSQQSASGILLIDEGYTSLQLPASSTFSSLQELVQNKASNFSSAQNVNNAQVQNWQATIQLDAKQLSTVPSLSEIAAGQTLSNTILAAIDKPSASQFTNLTEITESRQLKPNAISLNLNNSTQIRASSENMLTNVQKVTPVPNIEISHSRLKTFDTLQDISAVMPEQTYGSYENLDNSLVSKTSVENNLANLVLVTPVPNVEISQPQTETFDTLQDISEVMPKQTYGSYENLDSSLAAKVPVEELLTNSVLAKPTPNIEISQTQLKTFDTLQDISAAMLQRIGSYENLNRLLSAKVSIEDTLAKAVQQKFETLENLTQSLYSLVPSLQELKRMTGAGTEDNPYEVNDPYELVLALTSHRRVWINLNADLTIYPEYLSRIYLYHAIELHLDGRGHKIDVICSGALENMHVLPNLTDSEITNVTFNFVNQSTRMYLAFDVRRSSFKNVNIAGAANSVFGILHDSSFEDCNISSNSDKVLAEVGTGSLRFVNCQFSSTKPARLVYMYAPRVGGKLTCQSCTFNNNWAANRFFEVLA